MRWKPLAFIRPERRHDRGCIAGARTGPATLESPRQLGLELAIDDFGNGYSSFSYLTQFPFDHLKIDRSLVMNVERPGKSYAIVAAIVSLA